ncbi:hypothetical protein EC24_19980 [Salmonella enterica subsp. enterica serovar Bareilly str. CFSAN000181]|nr:hypothetical protein EC24_19980 [Salmonella enterica subsp. enterica serovar Bareilly str. CFSAN000181]
MRNNCRQREIKSWRAYSYGLRLSVHDMYATHVTIISLICIKNAYAANGHYRMQDHFSLDSIAAAREEIPGSIDNYVTGVSERSQQRGSLKDEVYITEINTTVKISGVRGYYS